MGKPCNFCHISSCLFHTLPHPLFFGPGWLGGVSRVLGEVGEKVGFGAELGYIEEKEEEKIIIGGKPQQFITLIKLNPVH